MMKVTGVMDPDVSNGVIAAGSCAGDLGANDSSAAWKPSNDAKGIYTIELRGWALRWRGRIEMPRPRGRGKSDIKSGQV